MTNQQGAPEALTDFERRHAIRQGHEIAASDGYFEARPQIDSNDRRKVFQAGFERGWDRHAALVEAQQAAPSAADRVKLPEPDTAETAPWTGWKVKYHSPDQIIGYGNQQFNAGRQFEVERLVALWAPQPSSAPQTDRQPAVQQWNDLIGKETHADADGLLVWRDEVDFAIPTPQADSVTAPAGGTVAAHRVMRKRLDGEWVCDGRYWCDGPPSKELIESICADKDRWRVDVAYTTQPAQAADSQPVPVLDSATGGDWTQPTTVALRLGDAMQLLCGGKRPPDDMVQQWLDNTSESLQEFAASNGPAWAQGIGLIDAAMVMVDQPTEITAIDNPDRDHEHRAARAPADSVLEDAARLWEAFIEAWRNEIGVDKIVNIMGGADKLKAVFLDAARKQGGA